MVNFLSGFTYEIEVVKSQANGNCDAFSRLPITDNAPVFETEYGNMHYIKNTVQLLDFKSIAIETAKDLNLRNIIKYLQQGWPKSIKTLNNIERNFFNIKLELTIEKNCLL